MKTFNPAVLFSGIILFSLLNYMQVSAYRVSVVPSAIRPGDAFAVKVEGAENSGEPSALFHEKPLYFSSCGDGCYIAIGAADISTEPGEHSVLLTIDGRKTNLDVVVKKAEFPTIHLTLPPGQVFLSQEDQERANREAAALKKIWPVISERLWKGKFSKPLDNDVSTVFGVKRIMNKKKTSLHRGVDFRGTTGEPVLAFNRGRVVLADDLFYGGKTVILDHGQGIYSIYMHLSEFNVNVNDILSRGAVVGRVGSSGRATGPHLHFGVKVQSVNTNPLSFMELDL